MQDTSEEKKQTLKEDEEEKQRRLKEIEEIKQKSLQKNEEEKQESIKKDGFPPTPVGTFFSTLVNDATLDSLRDNPGQRARLFDKSKGAFGFQGKTHQEKAKTQLDQIKPPLSETSVENVYKLFKQLNEDLENGGLNLLMAAFKNRNPQLSDKELDGIKSDIQGAYRFKVISASNYYDERTVSERQKDFLQLINKTSKESNSPEECLSKVQDKMSKELLDNATSIVKTTSDKDVQTTLLSSLLTQKHYEYLGSKITIETIKEAFDKGGKKDQFAEFEKQFEVARNLEAEVKELLKNPQANPQEALEAIHKNENFKKLGSENGTQLVMNQIMTMPLKTSVNGELKDNSVRNYFAQELPKQPLREFIDNKFNEFKNLPAVNIDVQAKELIKSIPDNKHYIQLNGGGNTSAAEVLLTKINSMDDSIHKKALLTGMYSTAEDKIKRRLQDNKSPKETLAAIRDDHLCAVLDKDEINKRISTQIMNLPKTQKDRIQPLLDELNAQTGEYFTLPKSKLNVMVEKAGIWFQKVGAAIASTAREVGSAIKSTINRIGSAIGSVFKKEEPPQTPNKVTTLTPQEANLFLTNNGKERSIAEVIQILKQNAYQQMIDNPTEKKDDGKSHAAKERLEQILKDYDTVFEKVLNDCAKNPEDFKKYTRDILDTTLVLERRKNQVDPSIKENDEEKSIVKESFLETKMRNMPPLPSPNDDAKDTPRKAM